MKSETSFRVFFLKQHRKNSLKNIFSPSESVFLDFSFWPQGHRTWQNAHCALQCIGSHNHTPPPWPTIKRILQALIMWALIGLPKALISWQSHLELKSSDNVCNALNWDHRRLQVVFPRAAIIRNLFSTVRVLHCGEMFSTVMIWGQVRWYKDHDVRSSSKQGSS